MLKNRLRTSIVVPDRAAAGRDLATAVRRSTSISWPASAVALPAANHELADFGDRRQRLAAKAERADAEQVVGVGDLAGGVAGDRQRQVVRRDAAAVVDDADQVGPALPQRHVDPRRPGIDACFRAAP